MKAIKHNPQLTRRHFIQGSGVIAGVTLSFSLPGCAGMKGDLAPKEDEQETFANAWVVMPKKGPIQFICPRTEMGQGTSTGLGILLCEALDYPLSKLEVTQAPAEKIYNHRQYNLQMTGGSSSISSELQVILNIGASLKNHLWLTALKDSKLKPEQLIIEDGYVYSIDQAYKKSYGQLANLKLIPELDLIEFKFNPKKAKYIGKNHIRRDNKAKILGHEIFGIDAGPAHALHATVIHAPIIGSEPKSCNEKDLIKLDGVKHVVKITNGFAIVAEKYYQALNAATKIQANWIEPEKKFDSKKYLDQCKVLVQDLDGDSFLDEGDQDLDKAKVYSAEYSVPYLAHAPLEPQNCSVWVKEDSVELWVPTQSPGMIKYFVNDVTGISEDKITAHVTAIGGGFGRRTEIDYVREATEISHQIKAPVKLIFDRQTDMQAGYYRPAAYSKIQAKISKEKLSWKQSIATQSMADRILPYFLPAMTPSWMPNGLSRGVGNLAANFMDGMTAKEGVDPPYNFQGKEVNWQKTEAPPIISFWRSVGHSQNAFFSESFVDELAYETKQDSYEFREKRMTNKRLKAVLEKVKDMSDWHKNNGRNLGIAAHSSFGSHAATVIEVKKTNDQYKITSVWSALDCGFTINPDAVHAQIMGSVIFGLTAAMFGKIEYEQGKVLQSNFHDYELLRANQCPKIYTAVLPSTDSPGGAGEPIVPVIAPALCNSLFKASGKRYRHLPLSDHLHFI